jgi:signal transduction histidine kinase
MLMLLWHHMPGMIAANVLVAAVFAGMFWLETKESLIGFWLALLMMVSVLRWIWNKGSGAGLEQGSAIDLERISNGYIVLAGVNGLAWGLLAWLSFNGERINQDFITIAVIVGMAGGGVTPLSALRLAYPVYATAILMPFVIKAIWLGGNIYVSGGMMLVIYLAILLSYSRSIHRTLSHAFFVQLEKDHLIRKLEAISHSRSLFLAGVSHDLKQPVQALGMFTACLDGYAREQSGPLGDELKRLSQNSKLALAAIGGQVSRLLELSRLEAGEVQPRRRQVRLADIFDYTRAQQMDKARDKGLTLRFVETDMVVVSDLKMLQSILDNLVSNAVRHTARGSVLVGARRRGDEVEIQVLDTGPGIPEDHIPLLFEAYRRFDDTARGGELTHGLGLVLVRKQMELLGHELRVRSTPGRGSLFGVRLPRATSNGELA